MTSLGAGCGLLGNFNGSMTGSIDCFGFGFVANRAGVGLDAGIFTGRSGRDHALIPLVSLRGNLFCFGRMADRAGKGLYALVFAGRCGRNHALVPAVSLRGNLCLCHENLIANRAMFAFGLAGCGAGGVDCRVDDLGVSLGGNRRAGAYFLAAILAVGIAGIAILGASGGFRVADLGIRMHATPHAITIADSRPSLEVLRFGVGAVGVVQLGGGDGDIVENRIATTCLRSLVSNLGSPGSCIMPDNARSLAGADIRTACCGIDSAVHNQCAIHINDGIRNSTATLARGRVCDRLNAVAIRRPDIVLTPLRIIINVQRHSLCHRKLSTCINYHLNTRQQCCVLIQGHGAGVDVHGHVVVDGQHINIRRECTD